MKTKVSTGRNDTYVFFIRPEDGIGVFYKCPDFTVRTTEDDVALEFDGKNLELAGFQTMPNALISTLEEARKRLFINNAPPVNENAIVQINEVPPQASTKTIPEGGISIFEFFPQDRAGFPSNAQGNGFVLVESPSHSRVCTPIDDTKIGAYSHIRYSIKEKNTGKTVINVFDTVGGFHPNFFDNALREVSANSFGWVDDWANNFKPIPPFLSPIDRCNNHLTAFNNYLLEGNYILEGKNMGNTSVKCEWGFIRESGGKGVINTTIEAGQDFSFDLPIYSNGNAHDEFKGNFNNYQS